MSGIDFVFNVADGAIAAYARLPASNDALVWVLLKSASLETDETLRDYHDLASLLAGSSDELNDVSYFRIGMTSGVTVTEDDTTGNNHQTLDTPDVVFPTLAGAAAGKLLCCYNPDTVANGALGVGHEGNLIPLTAHNEDITPDGTTVTFTVNGFEISHG